MLFNRILSKNYYMVLDKIYSINTQDEKFSSISGAFWQIIILAFISSINFN